MVIEWWTNVYGDFLFILFFWIYYYGLVVITFSFGFKAAQIIFEIAKEYRSNATMNLAIMYNAYLAKKIG
jgi:hypothetical protein